MRIQTLPFSIFSAVIIFIVFTTTAWADPLLLTDVEMKKLERYFPADDSIHLIWKGDSLSISLPLHQEKRVIFPAPVLPDLKGALVTDQLRIINDNKSLYLTALKPFSTTRLFVTLQDTGEVVLIDLSTNDNGNNATTYIDRIQNNNSHLDTLINTTGNNESFADSNTNPTTFDNDTYITLIRFAWQQLYAPKRLLRNPLGISRAPMHTESWLSTLVYGDKVYAHPEISWVYNNTYITAVELRNKYPHSTMIHLSRDLCGHWRAAALYPGKQLKPAGDKSGDSVLLFLISRKPFGESMEVCSVHA